jgi:hypothetical protein
MANRTPNAGRLKLRKHRTAPKTAAATKTTELVYNSVMPTRQAKEITFYCEWCYHDVTELRMPGPTPAYCLVHRKEALALSNIARMRKYRERLAEHAPASRPRGRPRKS